MENQSAGAMGNDDVWQRTQTAKEGSKWLERLAPKRQFPLSSPRFDMYLYTSASVHLSRNLNVKDNRRTISKLLGEMNRNWGTAVILTVTVRKSLPSSLGGAVLERTSSFVCSSKSGR